jgi:hypothetical protein
MLTVEEYREIVKEKKKEKEEARKKEVERMFIVLGEELDKLFKLGFDSVEVTSPRFTQFQEEFVPLFIERGFHTKWYEKSECLNIQLNKDWEEIYELRD